MKKKMEIVIKILKNLYNLNKIIKRELRCQELQKSALTSKNIGVFPYDREKKNIIVSLTTYNKRIYDVHLTIESLLNQTYKPNKIVLWLAEDEFNNENVPLILKNLIPRGLEIGFCKDLKSYKKLIPTLKKYPKEIIVTIDDDIIYPYDFIENLYKNYSKDNNCIYFYRGNKMKFDNKGNILPYLKWDGNYKKNEKNYVVLPTGVGGILYPPKCFHEDMLKEEIFMKLCPYGDDIWFRAMSLLKDIPCKRVGLPEKFADNFIEIEGSQDIALFRINVGENKNDVQIKKVFNYYNLDKVLKEKLI